MATSELYTLSLHDALPISICSPNGGYVFFTRYSFNFKFTSLSFSVNRRSINFTATARSEEHTSELQSRGHLVCRLLLEKKKYKRRSDMMIRKLEKSKCTNY